jgi:hypothetical protein
MRNLHFTSRSSYTEESSLSVIQLVGLIVVVYILARSLAEVTSNENGITNVGRIAFGVCFAIEAILTYELLNSGTRTP